MTERRTRLLLFTNSVAVGGMEEHVRLLAMHLDRERFEVFGVSPKWPPTEVFNKSFEDAVDEFATITPDRRYGVTAQLREMVRFGRQVRKWKIDVAHLHSTTYTGQMAAITAAKLVGIRRVFVTEHLAPDAELKPHKRKWRQLMTRLVTGIVCVSEKNRAARQRYLPTAPSRLTVVENGVDVSRFDPIPGDQLDALRSELGIAPDALIVGTAVRFEPEKGLDDLIAAFATVRESHPTAVLLMVGDGSLRVELESQATALGLADAVRWTGFQADPRPYLGLMDVFVLPVPVGSMSIGLLEAMAMRLPVVMTFGGAGEAVEHEVSGFSAEPRDPSSIASYVNRLLGDEQLRVKMGEAARERVSASFSAERTAHKLADLYLGIPVVP